jgi:hypothetical protein
MDPIQKTAETEYIGNLYEDIRAIEISGEDTLNGLLKKLHAVMGKHGICQGNWSEDGGRSINNSEWVMCGHVFREFINMHLKLAHCFNKPDLEQLLAYGEKPQTETK